MPATLVGLSLIVGTVLLFLNKLRAAKFAVLVAATTFFMSSCGPLANTLLWNLEQTHPPLLDVSEVQDVKWIVVLGGGTAVNPELPVTSLLNDSSLVRMSEGVRLHRRLPGTTIMFSGASARGGITVAEMSAQLAVKFGVDETNIVLETRPWDTAQEAQFAREWIGDDSFILVTSASHMRRAMLLFEAQGMNPVAAPTGHKIKYAPRWSNWKAYVPNSGHMRKMERVFYETMGDIWSRVSGLY